MGDISEELELVYLGTISEGSWKILERLVPQVHRVSLVLVSFWMLMCFGDSTDMSYTTLSRHVVVDINVVLHE